MRPLMFDLDITKMVAEPALQKLWQESDGANE